MNQIKSDKKSVHIIGIAGTMTAALAKALKLRGYQVSGSDQSQIYPPVSEVLKQADITVNGREIGNDIDLAVVGSSYLSFANTRLEFEQVKKTNIPYVSATEFIASNLVKNESIIVAGTFGKTTITSLLAWILINAGLNPSYMFGGESRNGIDSIKMNDSKWSVTEGDESIHGLDTKAKFLYYPAKYLILTDADWEHKDCYSTAEDNFNAFRTLVEKLPKDGILLINSRGKNTKELARFSQAKVFTYNSPDSDFYISEHMIENNSTVLKIRFKTEEIEIKTGILGQHNFENILAAVSMARLLGIDSALTKKSIKTYAGIKRRLELYPSNNGPVFFDDFAQSASRIESTINSIKLHFPEYSIKVLYDAHASYMQNRESLKELKKAFAGSDEIILRKLKISTDKENRVTARDFQAAIGKKLVYMPMDEDIVKHFISTLKAKDVLVHMSSGGLNSINTFMEIVNYFQKNV